MEVMAVHLPHQRLPQPRPSRTARLVRLWRLQRVERVLRLLERKTNLPTQGKQPSPV
jgi:hypothetical protein